ncbi:hypothetical protein [Mesorhizobium abyssinicae]
MILIEIIHVLTISMLTTFCTDPKVGENSWRALASDRAVTPTPRWPLTVI